MTSPSTKGPKKGAKKGAEKRGQKKGPKKGAKKGLKSVDTGSWKGIKKYEKMVTVFPLVEPSLKQYSQL